MHAVIFDIDGTLLQSAEVDDSLYREAVLTILGPVHFRNTLQEYDFVTDAGILIQVLADNGINPQQELLRDVRARFVEMLRSHMLEFGPFPALPGAQAMLRRLCESTSHTVGIATGGWRESAVLKLSAAGLDEFDIPLASANDAIDRTEIMEIALSRLGDRFESVTYYGDGPWDRDACAKLGWKFVPVGPALGGLESYEGALLHD